MTVIRYYDTEEDFRLFHRTLKQQSCPFCKRSGTLNLHGYLRGYSEHNAPDRIARGHRLFCNNRYRRPGCGKTVGILRSGFLKHFIITLQTLWLFLTAVAGGKSKSAALRQCQTDLHPSAAYRIFKRFCQAQSRIRSRLSRTVEVPAPPDDPHPFSATLTHLRVAFVDSSCPMADYQQTFQASLL